MSLSSLHPPMAPASLSTNSRQPSAPPRSPLRSGSPDVPTVGFAARLFPCRAGMGSWERRIWTEGLHLYGNTKTRAEGDPNEGWHKQGPGDGGTGAAPNHRVLAQAETSQEPSLLRHTPTWETSTPLHRGEKQILGHRRQKLPLPLTCCRGHC